MALRPARLLSKLARSLKSVIKIRVREKNCLIDAKSDIMIAAAGMMKGTKVEICAEGKEAEEAVTRMPDLIYNGFNMRR